MLNIAFSLYKIGIILVHMVTTVNKVMYLHVQWPWNFLVNEEEEVWLILCSTFSLCSGLCTNACLQCDISLVMIAFGMLNVSLQDLCYKHWRITLLEQKPAKNEDWLLPGHYHLRGDLNWGCQTDLHEVDVSRYLEQPFMFFVTMWQWWYLDSGTWVIISWNQATLQLSQSPG